MGYIIGKNSPFVNAKLTDSGREKLAKGKLNFKFWSLGDSEINYSYEEIKEISGGDETLNGDSRILKPIDNEPNFRYHITKSNSEIYNVLVDDDIEVIQAIVNNKARDRGFFNDIGDTITEAPYLKGFASADGVNLNGTNIIELSNVTEIDSENEISVGDLVLLKVSTSGVGEINESNTEPIPNMWYKIIEINGNNYTLDRNLPDYPNNSGLKHYFFYGGGEVYENGMANNLVTPYWNTNTLSFECSDDVTTNDVPFLNMNIVWGDNMVGLNIDDHEQYYNYGSNDYIGSKSPLFGYYDTFNSTDEYKGKDNGVGIIHYTNNSISNGYGEFFHIKGEDNKNLVLDIPNLMYHNRSFSTGEGTEMGMKFIGYGEIKRIENIEIEEVYNPAAAKRRDTDLFKYSDIRYVDLVEDPDMISGEPKIIGKILIDHKIILIEDDEILAAMSYKSNRNWTLPELDVSLITSKNGKTGGLLAKNKEMYVTYVLESDTLGYSLPCLNYSKIKNETSCSKDVKFNVEDIDKFPYMRKIEEIDYDGRGFNANKFKVLYQIVDEGEKPSSNGWSEYDFTNKLITSGETIDPVNLEQPNSNFILDTDIDTNTQTYVLNTKLNLRTNNDLTNLQFGEERFFYGNLSTYIGAKIYKTIFKININGNQFIKTTNPTRTDNIQGDAEIRVSEIGIYSDDKKLVFVGKLSKPIKLINGKTVTVELSMDF